MENIMRPTVPEVKRNKKTLIDNKTPLLMSPLGLALAACGGDEGSETTLSGPVAIGSWPYPSTVSGINTLGSISMQSGLSLKGNSQQYSTIELSPDLIEEMTPEGGSVIVTWFHGDVPQSVANNYDYFLTQDDVGKIISVEALFYDSSGKIHSVAAETRGPVLNVNDAPTGQVKVSGEMISGQILVADPSNITDKDGLGDFSYQWLRNGVDVYGATDDTYVLKAIDVGTTISVELTYVDGFKTTETLRFDSDTVVSITNPFKTISPVVSDVVGETNWGGTWYTGDSEFAVDGNNITKWTYEGLGRITFDMGANFNIDAITVSFNGSVSNGNYVNIYVDDTVVASGVQPASTKRWDIEDTVGRYVSYETIAKPHNEYLQVATWSEISELTILAQEVVL